jgi:acylphosphatase
MTHNISSRITVKAFQESSDDTSEFFPACQHWQATRADRARCKQLQGISMTIQSTPEKTLRLVIHGRVQGVFFRDSMQREAQRLAVAGWVRNRSDGTVEAAVHGESGAVDAIVSWARRGPQRARVERVEIEPVEGDFTGFNIIG